MFGLGKQGNGIGFHRILRFYNYANIPRDFFSERSIVITGSNGKGSTTRFIYALLQTKFSKVGCFTSPHLVDITERFEINGTQITHAALDHYVDHVLQFNKQLIAEGDSLGAFELLF